MIHWLKCKWFNIKKYPLYKKNKVKSVNKGAQSEFKFNKCIIIEREGEKKKNFLITIVGKVRTGTRCHNSGTDAFDNYENAANARGNTKGKL